MKSRKSFGSDGTQFAWDSTSVTLASECLRKYYYSIIAGIQPQGSKNVHLVFGGIYAKALEVFYKKQARGSTREEALRDVVRIALHMSFRYDEFGRPLGPLEFQHTAKTRHTLIRSIIAYIDKFGEESADGIRTHYLSDGKPAVELSVAVEFHGDLLYCGHLDRVVEYGGGLFWMDQKTTGGNLGPYYFEGFRTSTQFLGYTWAGQVVLQSPIRGGIIDAAAVAANNTEFARSPITFTLDQLEEWKETTLHHIAMARAATRAQNFPMNLSACGNYGGCPYRGLCGVSPQIRETMIRSNYVQVENAWDPLEAR